MQDCKIARAYKLNSDDFSLFIGKRIETYQTDKNYKYPVYSANVNCLFGYGYTNIDPMTTILELKNNGFNKSSILWGIDGDWNTNFIPAGLEFYPTDHCGVLRVNTEDINIKFLYFYFHFLGIKNKFDRNHRAKLEIIKNLSIGLPSIQEQNDIISDIEIMENIIKENEKKISDFLEYKKIILNKYL